jgi:hypothetical protein
MEYHQMHEFLSMRMKNVCIFYGHLEYFTTTWSIYGIYCCDSVSSFPVLVCCTKKNLATLALNHSRAVPMALLRASQMTKMSKTFCFFSILRKFKIHLLRHWIKSFFHGLSAAAAFLRTKFCSKALLPEVILF